MAVQFLGDSIFNATLTMTLKYTTKLLQNYLIFVIGNSSLNLLAKRILHLPKCFQLNSQEKKVDIFL